MKALNESFKLNLYKFSDRTNHNVDLDFVMRFFDELAGGSTVANTLVLGTVVFSNLFRRSCCSKLRLEALPEAACYASTSFSFLTCNFFYPNMSEL